MSSVHFRSYDDTYYMENVDDDDDDVDADGNFDDKDNQYFSKDNNMFNQSTPTYSNIRHKKKRHKNTYKVDNIQAEYNTVYQCILYSICILYLTIITFWIVSGDVIKTDHDVNLVIQYATCNNKVFNRSTDPLIQNIDPPLVL